MPICFTNSSPNCCCQGKLNLFLQKSNTVGLNEKWLLQNVLCFSFFKYKKSFEFDQIWMECFISFKTFVFHFYFLACTFESDDALPELKQQRRAAFPPSPSLPLCLPRGWTQIFGPAHEGVQMWGCQPGASFRPEVTWRCWRDSCPPCLSHHAGMLSRAMSHTTPARAIPLLGWEAVNPNCVGKVRPICCPHLNSRSTSCHRQAVTRHSKQGVWPARHSTLRTCEGRVALNTRTGPDELGSMAYCKKAP